MTRFVCVSTTFHLLVAQALLTPQAGGTGSRRELLLWRPMQRSSPIVLDSLDPYRRLVDTDAWDEVHDLEHAGWVYDLHRLGAVAQPVTLACRLRSMRYVEARLGRILGSLGPDDEVVVTNPTAGAIDRFVARRARASGARVSFLEDGVGAYLGASLKQAIDQGYWATRSPSSARAWLTRRWRSMLLRLAFLDARAVDLSAFDFKSEFRFDDVHVLCDAPLNVDHSRRRVRLDVEDVRSALESCTRRLALPEGSYEALYLSRPDSEDGLLDERDEVDLVAGTLRRLAELHHDRIAVKPHPRDRVEKLRSISDASGVDLVDQQLVALPAEVVVHGLKPQRCYGTWSGSLLYVSMLSGVATASVLPAMLESLADPPPRLVTIWEQLAPLFSPYVQVWEAPVSDA